MGINAATPYEATFRVEPGDRVKPGKEERADWSNEQVTPLQHLPPQRRRVALIASSGGHWIELLRISPAVEEFDCLFVSTAQGLIPPFGHRPVVQIMDGSRDTPWQLIKSVFGIYKVLRDFRPDVILTTGAAPGAVALLVGKLLGCVTIWTDSIANSEELSLSGKFARGFADLRLTQWEHLARISDDIRFMGRVI